MNSKHRHVDIHTLPQIIYDLVKQHRPQPKPLLTLTIQDVQDET